MNKQATSLNLQLVKADCQVMKDLKADLVYSKFGLLKHSDNRWDCSGMKTLEARHHYGYDARPCSAASVQLMTSNAHVSPT